MNKVFKVLYSGVRHCYVVVSEIAKRNNKTVEMGGVRRHSLLAAAITAVLLAPLPFALPAYADDTAAAGSSAGAPTAAATGTAVVNQSPTPAKSIIIGTDSAKSQATGDNAIIIGGNGNTASGEGAVVIGGAMDRSDHQSTASGDRSVIVGGKGDVAYAQFTAILGGEYSTVTGSNATVVGGAGSVVRGVHATGIAGGSIGTNATSAVAIGDGSVVSADLRANKNQNRDEASYAGQAMAIGYQATAGEKGTIAFGHDGGDVSGYTVNWVQKKDQNPDGTYNDYSQPASFTTNYYGKDDSYYNRLVKIADGIDDHDAATVEQLAHFYSVNGAKADDNNYKNDGATGDKAIAIGVSAASSGTNAAAIGMAAKSSGTSATALGSASQASGDHAAALGSDSTASGTRAAAIGAAAKASGTSAIALGAQASSAGEYASAIGAGAVAGGTDAIAAGHGTVAGNNSAIAIGGSAAKVTTISSRGKDADETVDSTASEAVGTRASGEGSIALGTAANAWGTGALAAGMNDVTTTTTTYTGADGITHKTVVEDVTSTSAGNGSVALGTAANAYGDGGIAIGKSAGYDTATVTYTKDGVSYTETAEAPVSTAAAKNSVALGTGSNAQGTNAIAIGGTDGSTGYGWSETQTMADGTVKTIYHAPGINVTRASGENSIALGTIAGANGADSLALGTKTLTNAADTVALGHEARADGTGSMALGKKAFTQGENAVALGNGTYVQADGSIAIGTETEDHQMTYVASHDDSAKSVRSMAIGSGAHASAIHSAAVGYKAQVVNGVEDGYAFGTNASVMSPGGIALGTNAFVNGGGYDTALGYGSNVSGRGSSAIGTGVNVSGAYSVALGAKNPEDDPNKDVTSVSGSRSVGLGIGVNVAGSSAVGIGDKSTASGLNTVAIGTGANASGAGAAYALGLHAVANGENAFAIGTQAQASGKNGMAIGVTAGAAGENSMALGKQAGANAEEAFAIGAGSETNGVRGVALGSKALSTGTDSLAMGTAAEVNGNDSVSIGHSAEAGAGGTAAVRAIAIGSADTTGGDTGYGLPRTQAVATDSVAIGTNANATGTSSMALGTSVTTLAANTLAIGNKASAGSRGGENAIAIGFVGSDGTTTRAYGKDSMALGTGAYTWAEAGMALGRKTTAGKSAIALGDSANAWGDESLALGISANAAQNSIAIGKKANGQAGQGIAIGEGASTYNTYVQDKTGNWVEDKEHPSAAIAIGNKASSNVAGGIALGSGSQAVTAAGVTGWDPFTQTGAAQSTGLAWQSTAGALSIGSDTLSRQITGVAAGTKDTDAVNVAQLHKVVDIINADWSWDASVDGNDSKVEMKSTNNQLAFNSGKNVALALDADKRAITVNTTDDVGFTTVHVAGSGEGKDMTGGVTIGKQKGDTDDANGAGEILSVKGLGNTKWDGAHITSGRAATEDQLKTVSDKADTNEKNIATNTQNISNNTTNIGKNTKSINDGWNAVVTNGTSTTGADGKIVLSDATINVNPDSNALTFTAGDNVRLSAAGRAITVAATPTVGFETVHVAGTGTGSGMQGGIVLGKQDGLERSYRESFQVIRYDSQDGKGSDGYTITTFSNPVDATVEVDGKTQEIKQYTTSAQHYLRGKEDGIAKTGTYNAGVRKEAEGKYVTGLQNTSWSDESYVSGRAATEDQLSQVASTLRGEVSAGDDYITGGIVSNEKPNGDYDLTLDRQKGSTVTVTGLHDRYITSGKVTTDAAGNQTLSLYKNQGDDDPVKIDMGHLATMDDGYTLSADNGTAVKAKLGSMVKLSGGAVTTGDAASQLADAANIGVTVSEKDGVSTYNLKLNQDLTGLNTVTAGSTGGGKTGVTVGYQSDNGKETKGNYVTGLDNKDWTVGQKDFASGRAATEDQLHTVSGQVETNVNNIAGNTTNISKNTAAIEGNTENINSNKTAIENNTKNISTNTANLAKGWDAVVKTADGDKTINVNQTQDGNNHLNLEAGKNIALTADADAHTITVDTARDVSFDKVTVGSVEIGSAGINAGGKTITSVASGMTGKLWDKDNVKKGTYDDTFNHAANIGDIYDIAGAAAETVQGKHTALTVEGGTDAGTDGYEGKNLELKVSEKDGQKTYDVKLAQKLTDLTSVTTGNTTIDNSGITVKKGDTVVSSLTEKSLTVGGNTYIGSTGIDANSQKITNVKDGTAATDAVNKGQLDKAAAKATTTVSAGRNVTVTKTTKDDGHTDYKVAVNDAVTLGQKGTKGSLTLTDDKGTETLSLDGESGTITTGAASLNGAGLTVAGTVGTVSLTKDNISMGGQQVHHVAAGTEKTDAVNKGQLDAVQKTAEAHSTVSAGNGISVTKTDNENGSKDYQVALADTITIGKAGQDGKDGTFTVTGKDGSSVTLNGQDGSLGLSGADGKNGVTLRGAAGKDGVTRLTYETKDGIHDVATMDDGLSFAGDDNKTVTRKLGSTLTVKGGAEEKALSGAKNIGVTENTAGDGLELHLAQNLTGLTSVTTGNATMNSSGLTISTGDKDKDIRLTAGDISMGGRQIHNVAAGTALTDAVNLGQLNAVMDNSTVSIYSGGHVNAASRYTSGTTVETPSIHNLAFDFGSGLKAQSVTGAAGDNRILVSLDRTITAGDGIKITTDAHGNYTISTNIAGGDSSTAHTDVKPEETAPSGAKGNRLPSQSNALPGRQENGPSTENSHGSTGKELVIDTDAKPLHLSDDTGKDRTELLGQHMAFHGDGNITTKITADKDAAGNPDGASINFSLSKDLKGLDSVEAKTIKADTVTTGNTTMNSSGLTIAGKDAAKTISLTTDKVSMGGNRIQNVADGKDKTDAVNYGQLQGVETKVDKNTTSITNMSQVINQNSMAVNQLSGRISSLDTRVNKVGAGAAALAALHPLDFDPDDKLDVAAGYGHYRGAGAAAAGLFYRPNENLMFSLGTAFGNGENMWNAGVSLKVGHGTGDTAYSKTAMAREIVTLQTQLQNQDDKLSKQDEEIQELKDMLKKQQAMIEAMAKK